MTLSGSYRVLMRARMRGCAWVPQTAVLGEVPALGTCPSTVDGVMRGARMDAGGVWELAVRKRAVVLR